MEKSYKIQVDISKKTLGLLAKAIKEVSDPNCDKSFILQVGQAGNAKGLALCSKDAERLKKLIQPFWDSAAWL